MVKRREFGELELAILTILKTDHSMQITVKDVCDALKGSNRYTTIMTVMTRLAQKGELKRKKIGRQYVYEINEQKASSHLTIFERLKKRLFGGKSLAMINYLIDSSEDLTEEELYNMQQLIDKAKQERKKNG